MKNVKNKKEVSPFLSTAYMLALGLLACCASLTMRASAGIWTTVPLYPICIAAACLLPVKPRHRVLFFGGITLFLNLAESTPAESLPYLLVALGCIITVSVGMALIKLKKVRTCGVGILLILGYLVFSFFYMGNPFVAFDKSDVLNEYIDAHYGDGNHFENVRFDPVSGCYAVTAYNEKFPAETAEIFLSGDTVVDHYRDLVEDQTMREHTLKITMILREAFPADSFTVSGVRIEGFLKSGEKFDAYETKADPNKIHYYVELMGRPNYDKYYEGVQSYATAFSAMKAEFASVTYLCGTGLHFRVAIVPGGQNGIFPTRESFAIHTVSHPENHYFLRKYEDWNLAKRIGSFPLTEEE